MPIGTNNTDFLIRVKADLADALSKMDRLQSEFGQTAKQGKKAAQEIDGTGQAISFLKRAVVAYISLNTAKQILHEADSYNILQDRIKTATKNFGDYNTVRKELFAQSQATGSALEANVELFQRIARAAPSLEATQDQVLAVTKAINQLGVISGATNDQMKFGLLQLGQAFSSNVVRAEEVNSILENIPEVAARIEKGLGLLPGSLKNAVNEGKVLSRDVFEALLGQTEDINKEFNELEQRLSRAEQRAANSFARISSNIDAATESTSKLAEFLTSLSLGFDALSDTMERSRGIGLFEDLDLPQLDTELTRVRDRLSEIGQSLSRQLTNRGTLSTDLLEEQQQLLKERAALLERIEKLQKAANEAGADQTEVIEQDEKVRESIEKTIKSMELDRDSIGKTRREIALLKLEQQGATEGQRAQADAILAEIEIREKQAEAAENAKKAQEDLREEIDKTLQELEKEAETTGLTTAELVDYELAALGASDAQREQAKAYVETVEAAEKFKKAQEEAKEIIEAIDGPMGAYLAQVEKLWQLYDDGLLSTAQLTEGLKQAKEGIDKLADGAEDSFKDMEAAIRGWGDDLTNTIVDAVTTGKASFKDLADSIIRDLLRIAIQKAFTDKLVSWYSGLFTASSGGGTGTASVGHTGGMAGNLSGRRSVSPALFANAPRFHAGFPGLAQDEIPAILTTKERVLSPAETRAYNAGQQQGGTGGATKIEVNVHNEGTPQQANSASARVDGEKMIIDVFTSDVGRNGPASQMLQRTFNLQRRSG